MVVIKVLWVKEIVSVKFFSMDFELPFCVIEDIRIVENILCK